MTEKRFMFNSFFIDYMLGDKELKLYEIDNNPSDDLDESNLFYVYSTSEENVKQIVNKLNELVDENEQLRHDATVLILSNQEYRKENDELKQYKQAVSDILWDWYRKDGSLAIWRIMKELNVDGDVE